MTASSSVAWPNCLPLLCHQPLSSISPCSPAHSWCCFLTLAGSCGPWCWEQPSAFHCLFHSRLFQIQQSVTSAQAASPALTQAELSPHLLKLDNLIGDHTDEKWISIFLECCENKHTTFPRAKAFCWQSPGQRVCRKDESVYVWKLLPHCF